MQQVLGVGVNGDKGTEGLQHVLVGVGVWVVAA